jgi:hypothetical protein
VCAEFEVGAAKILECPRRVVAIVKFKYFSDIVDRRIYSTKLIAAKGESEP